MWFTIKLCWFWLGKKLWGMFCWSWACSDGVCGWFWWKTIVRGIFLIVNLFGWSLWVGSGPLHFTSGLVAQSVISFSSRTYGMSMFFSIKSSRSFAQASRRSWPSGIFRNVDFTWCSAYVSETVCTPRSRCFLACFSVFSSRKSSHLSVSSCLCTWWCSVWTNVWPTTTLNPKP